MHLARNCEGTEQLRIFYDYDPKVLLTLFSVTKKGPPDLFVVCLATQKSRTSCSDILLPAYLHIAWYIYIWLLRQQTSHGSVSKIYLCYFIYSFFI